MALRCVTGGAASGFPPGELCKVGLAVVKVSASWCAPCQRIHPVFLELLSKIPDVEGFTLDADVAASNGSADALLLSTLRVSSLPTFVSFRYGQEVSRFSGADEAALQQMLAELGNADLGHAAQDSPRRSAELDAQIAQAINEAQPCSDCVGV